MSQLYVKRCKTCDKVFKTDNKRASVCGECKSFSKYLASMRAKERQRLKRVRKEQNQELMRYIRAIDRYNSQMGTKHSYGNFGWLLSCGKLDNNLFDSLMEECG